MVADLRHEHQLAIIGIQREHQIAIIARCDNKIQTIQCKNLCLQGDIKNVRQTVTNLIENRCNARTDEYDNVLSVFVKNQEDEPYHARERPYCLERC